MTTYHLHGESLSASHNIAAGQIWKQRNSYFQISKVLDDNSGEAFVVLTPHREGKERVITIEELFQNYNFIFDVVQTTIPAIKEEILEITKKLFIEGVKKGQQINPELQSSDIYDRAWQDIIEVRLELEELLGKL